MTKKTLIWILINIGIVVFCFMSIIIYYLVPAAESGADYIQQLIENFIDLFR